MRGRHRPIPERGLIVSQRVEGAGARLYTRASSPVRACTECQHRITGPTACEPAPDRHLGR